MMPRFPLGPVMLDIAGTTLTDGDRTRLQHPLVGGIILFARNFETPEQLTELTRQIHALRHPALPIAVDHEGGRVQRFRTGFTAIPPMRALGRAWDDARENAIAAAEQIGYVIAAELRACGVDLSFTPVLDLDYGNSSIIGDRAFHGLPEAVTDLAGGLIRGLSRVRMTSVGKHFPGHGHVAADSHLELPLDSRALADIQALDLVPFMRLAQAGLGGVMPAHVVYPAVDSRPAGFSSIWLRDILRGQIGFDGIIFSDDLSMEGAAQAGGIVERASAAIDAGCDMVLVCNCPEVADQLLQDYRGHLADSLVGRLARLHANIDSPSLSALRASSKFESALRVLDGLTV